MIQTMDPASSAHNRLQAGIRRIFRLPSSPQYQYVKKAKLWSVWRIAWVAVLLAVGVTMLLAAAVLMANAVDLPANDWILTPLVIILVLLAFGTPAKVAIKYHECFRRWWHGLFFGFCYGAAIPMLGGLGSLLVVYFRFNLVPSIMEVLLNFIPSAALGLFSGVLFVVLWCASRGSRGKLLITHKAHCPNCAYNLIGNTSGVCPECGRAFTVEELEIAPEELHLHKTI